MNARKLGSVQKRNLDSSGVKLLSLASHYRQEINQAVRNALDE
jgi:hypothetical protein